MNTEYEILLYDERLLKAVAFKVNAESGYSAFEEIKKLVEVNAHLSILNIDGFPVILGKNTDNSSYRLWMVGQSL